MRQRVSQLPVATGTVWNSRRLEELENLHKSGHKLEELRQDPPTWYVETGEAAMKGVIDVCAIIRLVEMLYGEE